MQTVQSFLLLFSFVLVLGLALIIESIVQYVAKNRYALQRKRENARFAVMSRYHAARYALQRARRSVRTRYKDAGLYMATWRVQRAAASSRRMR